MNWAAIRPALKALLGTLSGLDTVWKDEPRPFGDTMCLLSITAVVGMGRDENRVSQDLTQPAGQELEDTWIGQRAFTLTVEVHTLIQTDTGTAYQYLEAVRDRLLFRGTVDACHAVNIAFVEALPTVDLPMIEDNRARSVAALDIKFAARTSVTDPQRYGYIATAPLTGTLTS